MPKYFCLSSEEQPPPGVQGQFPCQDGDTFFLLVSWPKEPEVTRTLAGTPAGVSPLGIGSSRFTKTEVTKTRITHFQSGSPEMIISGFISTSIPYFLALCVLLRTQYRDTYNDLQWSPNFVPSTFSPIIYSPSWF